MSYIRVVLRGSLPSGEVWSVSPAFTESVDSSSWDQARGLAAAVAVAALPPGTPMRAIASAGAPITEVRVERRTDGGVLLGAAEATYTGAWAGASSPSLPLQSSIVLSLRTNRPGGSGRGRLYWPAMGASLNASTLRVTSATVAALAQAAVVYLANVEATLKNTLHPTPDLTFLRLCVVSPTRGIKTDVTRIDVGDVLDVQRRRRDKVAEAYSTANYVPL